MPQSYKIHADFDPKGHTVKLLLNGMLGEDALPELAQSIAIARNATRHVQLDLSEVTLLDRKALAFLSRARNEVELINCPAYLVRWIQGGRK